MNNLTIAQNLTEAVSSQGGYLPKTKAFEIAKKYYSKLSTWSFYGFLNFAINYIENGEDAEKTMSLFLN